MNIDQILANLKSERDRLDRAIAALDGVGRPGGRGRPTKVPVRNRRGGARHMSAAARKRMSSMMKKRWAARKKAGKTKL